jgi:hypothetical protein
MACFGPMRGIRRNTEQQTNCNAMSCGVLLSRDEPGVPGMNLPAGFNSYTDMLHEAYNYLYNGAPDLVTPRLQLASSLGLKYARIWGMGDDSLSLQDTTRSYKYYNEFVRPDLLRTPWKNH